mmetsp:Transcript_7481/g.21226  ORF Transcript_7481/g.21226 Transcript_7481/m.21226 type:complete len:233 (-) Transcript_7481:25-723(-)
MVHQGEMNPEYHRVPLEDEDRGCQPSPGHHRCAQEGHEDAVCDARAPFERRFLVGGKEHAGREKAYDKNLAARQLGLLARDVIQRWEEQCEHEERLGEVHGGDHVLLDLRLHALSYVRLNPPRLLALRLSKPLVVAVLHAHIRSEARAPPGNKVAPLASAQLPHAEHDIDEQDQDPRDAQPGARHRRPITGQRGVRRHRALAVGLRRMPEHRSHAARLYARQLRATPAGYIL